MSDRPILFQGAMVRALLAGTKTQTRRVFKAKNGGVWPNKNDLPGMRQILRNCPYGQPGDRLWVREAWMPDPPIDDTWASTAWNGCGRVISEVPERFHHPRFCNYAADWLHGPITWRPSIYMPRWASRITLEVTGVRVERLQEISEADAQAEGCSLECMTPTGDDSGSAIHGPGGYIALWESINGPGSWDANPWLWVVEFKRVTP